MRKICTKLPFYFEMCFRFVSLSFLLGKVLICTGASSTQISPVDHFKKRTSLTKKNKKPTPKLRETFNFDKQISKKRSKAGQEVQVRSSNQWYFSWDTVWWPISHMRVHVHVLPPFSRGKPAMFFFFFAFPNLSQRSRQQINIYNLTVNCEILISSRI